MMVHIDVLMEESEIARIKVILDASGEETSVAAFIAVGAVHYLEDQERRAAERRADK